MIEVTYVFTPISERYISRAIYTLYKYSKPDSFRIVLVDQVKGRMSQKTWDYLKDKVHLYLHPPTRQLGYAKAQNEGILHALHWKTPYICASNDDLEIIDSRWMDGIKETFAKNERIGCVVPMSPRVAGWGYGVKHNPEVLPYKEEYTKEDYDYLLKGDFSDKKAQLPASYPTNISGTIVDGAVFVMPYFKRECLLDVGLMDEHFFPGSGEDVDWNARAYIKGWRVVSTSLSWIWHHWSSSKDLFASGELEDPYYKPPDHPYWVNLGELWRPEDNEGHDFDVWGHYRNQKGEKVPLKRVEEVFVDKV